MRTTQSNFYQIFKDRVYKTFARFSGPVVENVYGSELANVGDVIKTVFHFMVTKIPYFFSDLYDGLACLKVDLSVLNDRLHANVNRFRQFVDRVEQFFQSTEGWSLFSNPQDTDCPFTEVIHDHFITGMERLRMEEEDRSSRALAHALRQQRLADEQLRMQQYVLAQRALTQRVLDHYRNLSPSITESSGISFGVSAEWQTVPSNIQEQEDLLRNIFTAYTANMKSNDPNYDRSLEDFMDPVSLEFFRAPVIASDKRTYELSTLQNWLYTQHRRGGVFSSPLTRDPLGLQVTHNTGLIDEMIEAITWYRDEVAQNPDVSTGPGRSLSQM